MSRHSTLFCRLGNVGRLRFRSDDNGLFTIGPSPRDSGVVNCVCLRVKSFSPVSVILSSWSEEANIGRLFHREDESSSSIIGRTRKRDISEGGEGTKALFDRCHFEEFCFLILGTSLLNGPSQVNRSMTKATPEEYSFQSLGEDSLESSRFIVQSTVFISNNSLCITSFFADKYGMDIFSVVFSNDEANQDAKLKLAKGEKLGGTEGLSRGFQFCEELHVNLFIDLQYRVYCMFAFCMSCSCGDRKETPFLMT